MLRDTLIWALPAFAFAAFLRLLLLSYVPYAYWGSDSRSYYSFTHQLLDQGYVSLDEKRRYLYPLLLLPISILPGPPLKWLAWVQHGLGLLTILPLAYVVRKTITHWRWAIIPVTIAWSAMPMVLWYEHELLGETLFFTTIVWAIGGWCAWVSEPRLERSQRLFWWFLIPLGLFLLTKPSGRFILPGIFLALVLVSAWKRLNRKHWVTFAGIIVATLTMGSKKQAAWLLYVAVFPLTQLDTPKYADYKAEIRDMVQPLREGIDTYYLRDGEPFEFLESPSEQEGRPLWRALDKDARLRTKVYMDLAIEGVLADPQLFLYMGWQRILASANSSEFKEIRFEPNYYPDRFQSHYETGVKDMQRGKYTSVLTAMGISHKATPPPWNEIRQRLAPRDGLFAAGIILKWVQIYDWIADPLRLPRGAEMAERSIKRVRPRFTGIWLMVGACLSLLPAYRKTLGVWMLIAFSYLFGVFLVSQPNTRYFGPAWAALIPLLAIPPDLLLGFIRKKFRTEQA